MQVQGAIVDCRTGPKSHLWLSCRSKEPPLIVIQSLGTIIIYHSGSGSPFPCVAKLLLLLIQGLWATSFLLLLFHCQTWKLENNSAMDPWPESQPYVCYALYLSNRKYPGSHAFMYACLHNLHAPHQSDSQGLIVHVSLTHVYPVWEPPLNCMHDPWAYYTFPYNLRTDHDISLLQPYKQFCTCT